MNFEQFLERNGLDDHFFKPLTENFEVEMPPSTSLDARLFKAYDLAEEQGLTSLHDLVIKRMENDGQWRRTDARIGRALTDFQLYMTGCYLDATPHSLSDPQKRILDLLVAYEVLNLNFVYLRTEVEAWKQFNPDLAANFLAVLFPPSLFASEDECSD